MGKAEFKYQRCGACCKSFGGVDFTERDLDRWWYEGRMDIIGHPCMYSFQSVHDILPVAEVCGSKKEFAMMLREKEKEIDMEGVGYGCE